MEKNIALHKRLVSYRLKISKRARNMRLAVYPGGDFVVTVPNRIHFGLVERFILRKAKWVIDKLEYFKKFPAPLFAIANRKEYLEHKDAARSLAKKRLSYFNQIYQFEFNRISIRNQRTRWGSCSRKGNLNFNYKIALIPEHLADYVIVHELCHLKELNHSRNFWNLVAKTIPNYKEAKQTLKSRSHNAV